MHKLRVYDSWNCIFCQYKKALWEVLTGRRDGSESLASNTNGNLPSPFSDFSTQAQIFVKKGLNVNDLVVLSGAHTIGDAHCGTFSRRLYNFTGKGDADPSLNAAYAATLRTQCPNPATPGATTTVEMDPQSSLSFDNHYYDILVQKQGLFQSDAALLTNKAAAKVVQSLRSKNTFFSEFGKSMKKMGNVGVLMGNNGEIRKQCRFVN
jgi:peroxidase